MKQSAFFLAPCLIVLFIISGCAANQPPQLMGRLAPDSPTDLVGGLNRISFFSSGARIVGNLFLPPGYSGDRPLPALVMVSPESGVKEQSPGHYAVKLSRRGYAVLAFDHRSFGESEGEPRLLEDPFLKIDDIKNAVSYLGSLNKIDRDKVGILGICAGGGYATAAAAFDHRIRAVATASGIFDFTDFRPNVDNDAARAYFSGLMKLAGEGRSKYFVSGETDYTPGAFYGEEPEGEKTLKAYYKGSPKFEHFAKLFWMRADDFYLDPARGATKTWEDKRLNAALDARFALNASSLIHLVSPRPMLIIKGSKAISGYASDIAYKKAKDPKEVFVIDGAHHFDLYDNDIHLELAVQKLDSFFQKAFQF